MVEVEREVELPSLLRAFLAVKIDFLMPFRCRLIDSKLIYVGWCCCGSGLAFVACWPVGWLLLIVWVATYSKQRRLLASAQGEAS